MENKIASIFTFAIAPLIIALGYLTNAKLEPGQAVGAIEGSNFQGIIGIILLLMLVVSIFFIVGNIRMMLTKNFHKK